MSVLNMVCSLCIVFVCDIMKVKRWNKIGLLSFLIDYVILIYDLFGRNLLYFIFIEIRVFVYNIYFKIVSRFGYVYLNVYVICLLL